MPKLRLLLSVAALLLTTGCANTVPLQRSQVAAISRETPAPELERILGEATALVQFDMQLDGGAYLVRHYRLLTGTRPDVMVICTPACTVIPTDVPVYADYLVLQNLPQRTVHAWGIIEELSKDPDPKVSGIMPRVKQRLTAELAKK